MLNRTAERLYWIGRLTERAANVVRGALATPDWRTLEPGEALQADPAWRVLDSLRVAHEQGRRAREGLTAPVIELLGGAVLDLERALADGAEREPVLRAAALYLDAFSGQIECNVTRDEAWSHVMLGSRIERIAGTARIQTLQARRRTGDERRDARFVLRVSGALDAWRPGHMGPPTVDLALDLVLRAPDWPRSVANALTTARTLATATPLAAGILDDAHAELAGASTESLAQNLTHHLTRLMEASEEAHGTLLAGWLPTRRSLPVGS